MVSLVLGVKCSKQRNDQEFTRRTGFTVVGGLGILDDRIFRSGRAALMIAWWHQSRARVKTSCTYAYHFYSSVLLLSDSNFTSDLHHQSLCNEPIRSKAVVLEHSCPFIASPGPMPGGATDFY